MELVRGRNHTVTQSVTRPADTNAYTAGDVVANSTSAPVIITFPRATIGEGDQAILQQVVFVTSASVATKPDLELWLFDSTVVMDNDNAAFTPTDAEMETLIGVVAIPSTSFKVGDSTVGAGGNAVCDVQNIGMPVNTKANDNAIYGILVARNAYVPVSGEKFTLRLKFLD